MRSILVPVVGGKFRVNSGLPFASLADGRGSGLGTLARKVLREQPPLRVLAVELSHLPNGVPPAWNLEQCAQHSYIAIDRWLAHAPLFGERSSTKPAASVAARRSLNMRRPSR